MNMISNMIIMAVMAIIRVMYVQGVIFPAGVRVFPAGNLQNPQEILTKTLIIEQIL